MEPYERSTCSFIIKIWVEENGEGSSRRLWRGHITHVLTGQRHYLKALEDIRAHILPFLEEMGVHIEEKSAAGGKSVGAE